MKHNHIALLATIFLLLPGLLQAQSGDILISEFMAVNTNILADEDNDYSDWIEVYNSSDETVNLNGWYLTDKADNLSKWKFPAIELKAGDYIVVFASEKNRKNPAANLHTNFKLSSTGEYLAIVAPDLSISHHYSPMFPGQRKNISYGIYHGQEVFFATPTPGSENIGGTLPFAPTFSRLRGYYEESFTLEINNPGGAGQIYYTTDGTRPTADNATLYTTPVTINTTTPVSAVVINDEQTSSEVVTHTYFFLKDILKQPKVPAGYPSDWKQAKATTTIPGDYEMDQRVVTHPDYKDLMEESFLSLPTVSFVTNPGYLFSNVENATTGGIYIYTGKPSAVGVTWVRPASAEYFDPVSGKQFQINCGLKLHGGNSRNPSNSPKHGFELKFKTVYGPSKLNFRVFDDATATNEFNSLVFRAGYNNTWVKNAEAERLRGQYLNDPWAKQTQRDMGHPSAHERFVHLYLNGLYWGVYDISEELTNDYMESYLPGKEEEFDIIKETQLVRDGNRQAWDNLRAQIGGVESNDNYQKIQGRNPDGSINPTFQNLLDVDNYIDYILIQYYLGNRDWNKNNWTVARNRERNSSGFKFFIWDAESTFEFLKDSHGFTNQDAGNPSAFMRDLIKNADFRVQFADKVKKRLLDAGGLLTPGPIVDRYEQLAERIDLAMVAESARWGDSFTPAVPYTRDQHWRVRKNYLVNEYFMQRTDTVMMLLRKHGMYPDVDAPLFSHPAGKYTEEIQLQMSSNKGTIYFTTDGTDPRMVIANTPGAAARSYAAPVLLGSESIIRARAKNGDTWSAITEARYTFDATSSVRPPHLANFSARSYPNPFSETTRIELDLPVSGHLNVQIFTVDGRLVEQLFDGQATHGAMQVVWSPASLNNGLYICRISFNGEQSHLKLILR